MDRSPVDQPGGVKTFVTLTWKSQRINALARVVHFPPMSSERGDQLSLDVRELGWFRRLASDYTYAHDAVAPFFAGNPADPAAWRHAIARVQGRHPSRDAIASVLADQQRRRGAPAEALAASQRLRDPRTVAIVTGQQAVLFGGPMFTLLKALTAIKLADQVTREHGVPAIAVFWIDAEDHDWNEVSRCLVLDGEFRPRAITLPPPRGAGDVAVASVRLDDSIAPAVDELTKTLAPTEFTSALLSRLREGYAQGHGMVEAFGRWLESVLGPLGLVVYDSSDPVAKPLVRDVFAREIREPGRTAQLAASAGAQLSARGYHAQVSVQEDSVALFHLDGGRRPIKRQGDQFAIDDIRRSSTALLDDIVAHPAEFSPNVLLRPIVQDTIFPTVCYVAGPNELAYLAQLRDVYGHFGVPMPLIYPRATATLLDSAASRFLSRYQVRLESLQPQDEGALNRLLKAHLPASVDASFAAMQRTVEERMAALIKAVPEIDPTLEGAARSTLGRMQHELQALQSKIIHAAKRRDETLRRQFIRTQALAFPDGEPQERALGFIYFLNRYGPGLVEHLAKTLPLEMGRHWVMTM